MSRHFVASLHTALALVALLLSASCKEGPPSDQSLFEYDSGSDERGALAAARKIILNSRVLADEPPAQEFNLSLRGATYVAAFERLDDFGSKGRVWVGAIKNCEALCHVFVAKHGHVVIVSIDLPDAHFEAVTEDGKGDLVDFDRAGLHPVIPSKPDFVTSPLQLKPRSTEKVLAAPAPPNPSAGFAKVDVWFVADQDYLMGNNGGYARMALVFSKMKQAFIDSGVSVQFSYMGETIAILNSPKFGDEEILERITPKTAAPVVPVTPRSFIDTHRRSFDIVIMMRKYRGSSHCGIAWIGGIRPTPESPPIDLTGNAEWAYGVVDDGKIGDDYCDDYTLAHEIGHIFGSMHDHLTAGGSSERGAFDESFGHRGGAGKNHFVTIMGYSDTSSCGSSDTRFCKVGVFSNPNLRTPCFGFPCGIAFGAYAADNAKGFNAVRFKVAAWRGLPWFPVTVAVVGSGTGRVTGTLENGTYPAIDTQLSCPDECLTTAQEGHGMTLKAMPDAGSRFAGWSTSDAVPLKCGSDPTCLFYTKQATIVARFERQ